MGEALLIYAASEQDANLFYATRFWAPDPFIFFQIDGRKTVVMSDLEIDRAKEQSSVQELAKSAEGITVGAGWLLLETQAPLEQRNPAGQENCCMVGFFEKLLSQEYSRSVNVSRQTSG